LRANVIRTISSEYERTGYFWEQYNDVTGNGMRGHPFTGWTSLLLNIMAERY
jgi:mannosyl-oligosaccharide glucosidase